MEQNDLTIPEKLAADERGEYVQEKEEIAELVKSAMAPATNSSAAGAKSATKRVPQMTWFRLPMNIKCKMLDLYADMVSQMLGLNQDVNEELRVFLQEKIKSDSFRRQAKDIVYSTKFQCILCIKSLRILRSEDGEDYEFKLQIQP